MHPYELVVTRCVSSHANDDADALFSLLPHPPSLEPQVKVIHKWPRPPLLSAAGGAAASPGAAAAVAADHLPSPCLSWGPPQPSAARAGAPSMALLARGWGNSIQVLAATRVAADAGGGGGAGKGGTTRWPRLAVVKELSASAPVVAVEWLREQVCVEGWKRAAVALLAHEALFFSLFFRGHRFLCGIHCTGYVFELDGNGVIELTGIRCVCVSRGVVFREARFCKSYVARGVSSCNPSIVA